MFFKLSLVSQSCATLSASSLEYLSAVSSSHSFSEAVYLASLSFFRLICSKHILTSFYILMLLLFLGIKIPLRIDNIYYIS